MMHAELPVAALPVSTKLQTRGRLQVRPAPESDLNYQVPERRLARKARNEQAAGISNNRLGGTSTYRRYFAVDSL